MAVRLSSLTHSIDVSAQLAVITVIATTNGTLY